MILQTSHQTVYRYSFPSVDSHNEVRLKPLTDEFQVCRYYRLTTNPVAVVSHFDEPGGEVEAFSVTAPHQNLSILGEAEVETFLTDPFTRVDLVSQDWAFYADPKVRDRYIEFLAPSAYTQSNGGVAAIAENVKAEEPETAAKFLMALNRTLHETLDYVPGATDVHTKPEEVVELKAGVCQDFAHLMIACCRHVGIPARYVSGYLYCGGVVTMRGDQATHAWLDCLLPNGNWVGFDPTNNVLANDRHVRIHLGRDYGDVTPTRGVYLGAPGAGLDVSVHVERLAAPARGMA